MGTNLFPLLYKSGIKRDGTSFQGEYCTDGQWVRFQNGAVEKIGGMQALNYFIDKPAGQVIPTTFIATSTSGANQYFYISAPDNLYKVAVTPDFQVVPQGGVDYVPIVRTGFPGGNNWLWQSKIVSRAVGANGALVRTLVVYGCQIATNITQNSQPYLAYVPIESNPFNTALTQVVIPAEASGGIAYAPPYLFFYGANGFVGYSRPSDPVALTGAGSGSFTLPSDKVIYGTAIRGGTNSPALIFWTLSTVVKVINVGDQNVDFKVDTIFNNSSILSSRCVVEYDSMFFWIGTDRFFVFNGLVGELKNIVNQKYFFDNIDLSKRQLVHGVNHPSKGEIWWYYPERGQPADVGCTRAIIFNVRDNSWYDTAITRDSTYYFNDIGKLFSYGLPLINPDNRYYLWQHETGFNQVIPAINIPPINLITRNSPIPGFIVTPTISWTAFNPLKQATGIDKWVELKTIEPDFQFKTPGSVLNIIVNTKEYAQSQPTASNPFTCVNLTRKIDTNLQGRHMSFTIRSNNYFSMGHVMISLATGDGR